MGYKQPRQVLLCHQALSHGDDMRTNGKVTIKTERLPIKLWLKKEQMDEGALQQARNLANLPFAFKHIAIMPDTHQGYGMPIGAVLATKGVIIPNAVGV
ncbi:MAG TPA: RtcB family protein, partial [Gammaproteobacteria bacterium]|nr:RtcB family protein [Gammaproteobacteria bacterium]